MDDESLRAVLDLVSDGIVAADGEGRIVWVNRAAECLLGPAAELMGREAASLLTHRPHQEVAVEAGSVRSLAVMGRGWGGAETAHDFRNVLSVVRSYATFAREAAADAAHEGADERWASVRDDVAAIEEAVNEGLALCERLVAESDR